MKKVVKSIKKSKLLIPVMLLLLILVSLYQVNVHPYQDSTKQIKSGVASTGKISLGCPAFTMAGIPNNKAYSLEQGNNVKIDFIESYIESHREMTLTGNTQTLEYVYNANSQLVEIKSGGVTKIVYSYDNNGNLISIQSVN